MNFKINGREYYHASDAMIRLSNCDNIFLDSVIEDYAPLIDISSFRERHNFMYELGNKTLYEIYMNSCLDNYEPYSNESFSEFNLAYDCMVSSVPDSSYIYQSFRDMC